MRHLRSSTFILTLTAMTLAVALPLSAQTSSGTGAADTGGRTLEKKVYEATDEETPAPLAYNILDDADEAMFLSLAGWSSKYRMSPNLQDGDWVKYESLGDGPKETLEIRAAFNDDGTIWIVETTTVDGTSGSSELHLLLTPGKPKLLQAFRVAADGTRTDLEPLDDITSGELFMEARQMAIDELGGDRKKIKVYDDGDVQRLEGPFGALTCRSVEVRVAEELDPISFAVKRRWLPEGTLLWMNEDVPRIMPMSAVLLPAMLAPDSFMTVVGGLVKSPYHVLVDYKGMN